MYSFPDVQYVVCLSLPATPRRCVAVVTFDPAMLARSPVLVAFAFELLSVSVVWYPASADELVGQKNSQI